MPMERLEITALNYKSSALAIEINISKASVGKELIDFIQMVYFIIIYFVGSMDQESSQQLQMWFSEHFFAPKLVA